MERERRKGLSAGAATVWLITMLRVAPPVGLLLACAYLIGGMRVAQARCLRVDCA